MYAEFAYPLAYITLSSIKSAGGHLQGRSNFQNSGPSFYQSPFLHKKEMGPLNSWLRVITLVFMTQTWCCRDERSFTGWLKTTHCQIVACSVLSTIYESIHGGIKLNLIIMILIRRLQMLSLSISILLLLYHSSVFLRRKRWGLVFPSKLNSVSHPRLAYQNLLFPRKRRRGGGRKPVACPQNKKREQNAGPISEQQQS